MEGAVAADGVCKLVSGLAGIMPTQTIGISVPTVDLTGVGARRVGIAAGAILIVVVFVPKALALWYWPFRVRSPAPIRPS